MADPDFATFPLVPKGHAFEDFHDGQVFEHHWGRTLNEGDNSLFATVALRFIPFYFKAENDMGDFLGNVSSSRH